MWFNFIVIALRNAKRKALFSIINVVGLAFGIAVSLVIFLFVFREWSHDRDFENADKIFRVGIGFFNIGPFANGPILLKEVLPKEFQGVQAFTSFQKNEEELLSIDGKQFNELTYYVDSSFFRVFSYSFLAGDGLNSMGTPHSVVITEDIAKKFFNDRRPLGEIIEVGEKKTPYQVTGVVSNTITSHLTASIWLSESIEGNTNFSWTSASYYNYVLLHSNSTRNDLKRALDGIIAKMIFPNSGSSKKSVEEYQSDVNSIKFFIQPLKEIYLKSKMKLEVSPGGNETTLYIFSFIAVLILILASVNFINLLMVQATDRVKEIGIRKTLGSSRAQLISLFILEALIISLISAGFALLLGEIFSNNFYLFAGYHLAHSVVKSIEVILGTIAFAFLIGFFAGLYPAVYLTSFKTVNGFKYAQSLKYAKRFFVVFQFAISITLVICTIVVNRQLSYMSDKDLGFNEQNVIIIDNLYLANKSSVITLRDKLRQRPEIVNASIHRGEPGGTASQLFYSYKSQGMKDGLTMLTYFGDEDCINAFGFDLITGRNFAADLASDSTAIILNESAVKNFNIIGDPIGTLINDSLKVIGVVRDFHSESLRAIIAPVIFMLPNDRISNTPFSQMALKFNSQDVNRLLETIQDEWERILSGEELKYHFLEDNFANLMKSEQTVAKMVGLFTVLAIIICCLGLFGLAGFIINQRAKEIGVRKVLGASVISILIMVNKQFIILVLVAICISIPASFYFLQEWLGAFAYHVSLDPLNFIFGGVIGLIVSIISVSYYSLRASFTNPSEILKED